MNKKEIFEILHRFNIQPTRSLGQNFLTDDRVIDNICEIAELKPDDLVIEIGPGIGGLTRELCKHAGQVAAIEIDQHVLPALQHVMADSPNCTILHGDALVTDLTALAAGWTGDVKVVANLPYYITTPLIVKILVEIPACTHLVLMIQAEAVARIIAGPGSKQYGPLAVLAQSFGDTRREIMVPAASFHPKPHVDSCVIRMKREDQLQINDWPAFHRFLEKCFAQRRKMFVNSLRIAGLNQIQMARLSEVMSELGVSAEIRAEMITKEQFAAIYHRLYC